MLSGKRFYAHRICLLASSDAFRAMFDGGYRVSIYLPSAIFFHLTIYKLFSVSSTVEPPSSLEEKQAKKIDLRKT